MRRKIRKQTRCDFQTRIKRLDPEFAAQKPSERYDIKPWEAAPKRGFKSENPLLMMLLGGVFAFVGLLGFHNPDDLKNLLLQYGWPPQFLTYAMNGVAILTLGLAILLLVNILRIFNPRASGRWNAGGLVIGAATGVMVFNFPGQYLEQGYALMGFDSASDVLDYAQARTLQLANIDWGTVVMVSSDAK